MSRKLRLRIEKLESRNLHAADIGLEEIQLFADPVEAPSDDIPAEIAVVTADSADLPTVDDGTLAPADVDAVLVSDFIQTPAPAVIAVDVALTEPAALDNSLAPPDQFASFPIQSSEIPSLLIVDDIALDERPISGFELFSPEQLEEDLDALDDLELEEDEEASLLSA